MKSDLLDDYRWLVSDEGAAWLDRMEQLSGSLTTQTSRLRKSLTASRTHLVLEQRELRRRARQKFDGADRMFFTRQGLEQATDQWIAEVKSQRFAPGRPMLDLCCGIGGDLIGLSRRAKVMAFDLDPVLALLAESNCRVSGDTMATIVTADAADAPLEQFDAWHIDPDRRPHGHRTTRLEESNPSVERIERMLLAAPNAAIKLAHRCGHW